MLPSYSYYARESRVQGIRTFANGDGNRAVSAVFDNGPTPNNGRAQGNPAKLSWSIVPNGTSWATGSTASSVKSSTFIEDLDNAHNVPQSQRTSDLTRRPWFRGIKDGMDLISKRSGITFVYEPNDDGAPSWLYWKLGRGDRTPGRAGVRGDLRFAGGAMAAGGLSSASASSVYCPDVYINTNNHTSIGSLRFLALHESMHALGFQHSDVNNTFSQSTVSRGGNANGPQFDDLCGLHRKYGDVHEKDGGNDTMATALDLGNLGPNQTLVIGDDASDSVSVRIDQFDFISIDDDSDTDFLSFTVTQPTTVTVTLDPRGPTYFNRMDGSTYTDKTVVGDEISDLKFSLLSASGQTLSTQSRRGLGETEKVTLSLVAGKYYVKVNGDAEDTQLYALSVSSGASQAPPAAPTPTEPVNENEDLESLMVEAESFTSKTGTLRGQANRSASGNRQAAYIKNGSTATYKLDSNITPGDYVFSIKYAAPRKCDISIETSREDLGSITLKTSSSWNDWYTYDFPVTITRATDTIKLGFESTSTSWLCNVDYFKLENAFIIQGEEYDRSSGVRAATSNGVRYVDYGGKNSYATWENIDADAGTWNLTVTYANGSSKNCKSTLYVNGAKVDDTLWFSPTQSWNRWRYKTVPITLRNGSNSIKIVAATSRGGANIDKLSLIPAAE